MDEWGKKIFGLKKEDFTGLALEIFRFQYENNPIYHLYTDTLGINPAAVQAIPEIPFLPVSFFKTHPVKTTDFTPDVVFESSGTTGTRASTSGT